MLIIETSGSWGAMGEEVGRTFSEALRRCMDRYCPWLLSDPAAHRRAIRSVRALLEKVCPELLEETEGLARGADLDPDITLGYRFFNEVRERIREGCSVIYLAESEVGPLLGRNCDLSPTFDAEIQLCRICRPETGPDRLTTTYLGMAGGVGLNESGLGIGGASAHTPKRYGDEGLPGQVLDFLLLDRCSDVSEAQDLAARHRFLGKSSNLIVGDAHESSVLFERAPGRMSVQVERPRGRNGQVCTNFFISGEIPMDPQTEYLQSAYARYGRMMHQLTQGLIDHSVEGMKRLLTDIAQPGLCDTGRGGQVKTAYSQVMELASGKMHYTPDHPAESSWQEISL